MTCKHLIAPVCGCKPEPETVLEPEVYAEPPELDQEMLARMVAVEGLRRKIKRRRQRESLAVFFQEAWKNTNPGTVLEWGPHIQAVCDHVQWQLEDRARAKADHSYKLRAQDLVINVPPRSLKPVSEDGLVVEKHRGLIPLKEVKVDDYVLTHKGRFRRVENVALQGDLPLLEIVTGRGRKIRAAGDHPFLTQRGWVDAQDLTPQDVLAETHGQEPAGTQTVPHQEARLLAYLIGDGGLTQSSIKFTNQDPETLADFRACAESLGFYTVNKATKSKATDVALNGGHGEIAGLTRVERRGVVGPVRTWLRKHGLEGKSSYTKRAPKAIMEADEKTVANYLAAYWACDGDIHDRRDLPRNKRQLSGATVQTVRVSATTVSEGLARDHQALLQRLGLRFRVRRRENKKLQSKRQGSTYVSWDIVASDQDTAAKFMQIVGPRINHEKRNRAQGLHRNEFDRVLYADNIVSVTAADPGPCRCLQVEEDSSFVYEGVAVHNTKILTYATVWAWLRWPEMRIMYLSANPRVALNSAREARDLIISQWFRTTHEVPWTIRTDQNALSDLGNSMGGARIARGLDSTITGEGCIAGHELVATEWGDIPIADLVAMQVRPRVWSRTPEGELELRTVTAGRMTGIQQTVVVRTLSGNLVECTDDHRIWTTEGYQEAQHIAGRTVSILPRADCSVAGASTEMLDMRQDEADLSGVSDRVLEGYGRVRQGTEEVPGRDPDVFTEVQLRAEPSPWQREHSPGHDPQLLAVHGDFSAPHSETKPEVLFEGVFDDILQSPEATEDLAGQGLWALPYDLLAPDLKDCVLLQELQERGSQYPDAGQWEFESQGGGQTLLRRSLGEPGPVDSRTGRTPLYGMWREGERQADTGPSRGPHPSEQLPRESDRAVLDLPHDSSQVEARPDTVLSVDPTFEGGRRKTIPVYDITVEGNHNFFVGGVLVHNCEWLIIDDPHDLRDSIENIEKCIEGYDSAVHNRINDPRAAIRTCIMQRVNIMDFSAHILRKGWIHVRIPMEFEKKPMCVCPTCVAGVNPFGWKDQRNTDGEILHPRFTPEFLAGERLRLGSFGYASQMQQRPAIAGGGRIKKENWGFFRLSGHHAGDHPRPPGCNETSPARVIETVRGGWNHGKYDFDWKVLSVDAANKKTERGSAYGMLCIAGKDQRRFVLDDRTQRGEFTDILNVLRDMIVEWRPDKILIEAKAAGPSLMSSLETEVQEGKLRAHDLDGQGKDSECHGRVVCEETETTRLWRCSKCGVETKGQALVCAIDGIEVDMDKERRVDSILPQLEARLVYILEGAKWAGEFVEEHALFPESPWNDRVDSLSQVLEVYKDGPFYVL